jgi:hypothetical protein
LGAGLLIVGLLPILGACYPYDRESTSDYDVVATTFDPSVDFSTKQTYARPPDVRVVTDPDQDEADDTLNLQVQQAILAAIDQNMAALGYTPANPNDPTDTTVQPDVVVVPFATESTFVGGACYPYYWDYWYGGYGWCYPVYYSYTTGTVVISMRDPNNTSPTAEPMWVAGINGIIDTAASNAARVSGAIDAAFSQSPYLKTN